MAKSNTMNTKPNLINDLSKNAIGGFRSEGNMAQIEKHPTISRTAKSVLNSFRQRAVGSYKVAGVASSLLFATSNAFGLGLGVLDVESNLDQPLDGLITINVAPGDDLSTLSAAVASREEFEALGVDYPEYLQNIKLVVERRGEGAVLRVSSEDVVIKEPFIHFLVKVSWSGGNFVREYTALIDPPVYAAETPRAISRPREVSIDSQSDADAATATTYDEPALTAETVDEAVLAEQDSSADIGQDDGFGDDSSEARYGPVAAGESLSLIAQELQREVPDLSIYAIMQALFEENPDAFIGSNINGLIKGSILKIRDLDQIRAADLLAARRFFQTQVADWDPGLLTGGSDSDSGLGVGQDTYTSDADLFSSDSGSSDTDSGSDSFQVGASTDTDTFVSSAEGDSNDGEVLALRQEISQLQGSLASSELENQELTERISILEGQLADMNRLMSLDVESADMANIEATLGQQNQADELDDGAEEVADSTADDAISEFLDDGETDSTLDDAVADNAGSADDLLSEFLDDSTSTDTEAVDDLGLDAGTDSLDAGVIDEVGGDELVDDSLDAADSVITEIAEDQTAPINPPVVNTPAKSESIFDKVGGLVPVIGGIGALLLAGLGLFVLRRRRADEEFEISMLSIESNSQSVDMDTASGMSASISASVTASAMSEGSDDAAAAGDQETSFLTVYSDSDAVVQADEVDPIAEADVYIAYGRDEQAEEVLLDGVAAHPDRIDVKQKLIGLYFKNKNNEGFERMAEELYTQRDSMSGEEWQEISDMGKELVPENPLFSLSGDDFDATEKSSDSDEAANSDSDAGGDKSEMIVDSLNDDPSVQLINFDDGRSEISELDEVEIDALAVDGGDDDVLEFNSSSDDVDVAADEAISVDLSDSAEDLAELSENDLVLDFDSPSAADADAESDSGAGEERKFSEVPEVSDLVIDPEYDEAQTQFELAKVFVDLGDDDGARKILEELVGNSANSQEIISKSQELLDSMGS